MRVSERLPRRPGTIGFYKRKFFFFVALFLMVYAGSWYISRENRYQADVQSVITSEREPDIEINLEVSGNGKVYLDNKLTPEEITSVEEFDELRLPILDKPGKRYDLVRITLILPSDVAHQTKHEILGIHGVGQISSYVKTNRIIVYEATDVSAFATLSIVAQIPKGTIDYPIQKRVWQALSEVEINVWITLGISIPIFTFAFMALFILYQRRRQKIELPDKPISAPPMALPAAIVGVLINQKVRSREIAATLVDLAVRGDILIIDRERGFVFGKGRFDNRLLGYEKILLSKIFRNNLSADRLEIEKRINNHFYSRKISIVSASIYALATRLGYFKTNPQLIHAKYRLIGFVSFLVGLAGFFLSLFLFTNPPYIVFFWFGMMIASLIITFAATRLPIRTPLGQEVLTNWLAFKEYLSSSEPIPYSINLQELFQQYLPYAIIFNCEAAWAKRFTKHNFVLPRWFMTDKSSLGLEEFCLSLFPIISYVSKSLVMLREPGFE